MNLYFLVEGQRTEKKIYRSWLSYVFPHLRLVDRPEDVTEDCIRLIAVRGYPQYLRRAEEALEEIATIVKNRVDHVFVCVDAEESSLEDRLSEVEGHIQDRNPEVRFTVIVQNCCMETWFLGNRRFVKMNPESGVLRRYKEFYNVRESDPEQMAAMPPINHRAQFHYEYMREVCRERSLSYTKKRPGPTPKLHYLAELARRYEETTHLGSFGRLYEAWQSLGVNWSQIRGESKGTEP